MLQLRPNCECCNRDPPPDTADACICSFECTFGARCAGTVVNGICPNCDGERVLRPRRPAGKLLQHPVSTQRVYKPRGCTRTA